MDKRNRRKRKRGQTLQAMGIKILIPVFFVILGLLSLLFVDLAESRNLLRQYERDTAELYVGNFNRDISLMNREMILVLESNDEIGTIPNGLDSRQSAYYSLFQKIQIQNRILKLHYRTVDHFFMYAKNADVLVSDSATVFPYSYVDAYTDALRGFCRTTEEHYATVQWDYFTVDDDVYIIGWYVKGRKLLGCSLNLENIFSALQEMPRNYDVIPYMKKPDGTLLFPEGFEEPGPDGVWSSLRSEQYEYQLGTLGKLCVYVVPKGGTLESILQMQTVLIGLVIALLFFCLFLIWRYYQGLMRPLGHFVEGIIRMEEEQFLNENGKNNILELEAVSEQFRMLLRKIRSLKIAIYEKELNEQRAELEYLQEQIRPHFTLNCLSLIYGIADARKDADIMHITKVLSEYIRYNYRDSGTERKLEDELCHVRKYMELQTLRYGEDAFRFEVIEDGLKGECLMPPLVLQTLIENAVVHAVDLDQKVEISLYLTCETYEDGTYLYLCVSDTGKGFSKEVIEQIEKDLPIVYGGRKHVGLQNVRRRLKLLYGERASLVIQNMDENYGAVVEVRIPQKAK